MSDYQLTDQFLLDQATRVESNPNVSRSKRVLSIYDNNQGSYQSGVINIDAASQLTGAKGFASIRDGYLILPYVITMKNTGAAALGAAVNRYCAGLKCGVWNLIDSLSAELDGKALLTDGDYKMYWNNFRAMTEWSSTDVEKMGSDAFLSPDDWVSMSFSAAASPSGDGFSNNCTNINAVPGLTPDGAQLSENSGFIERLYSNPQPVSGITSGGAEIGLNSYNWVTQRSTVSSTIANQNAKGAFVTTCSGTGTALAPAAAGQIAGTWYLMTKIRLVDLHPVFKELDLIGNPQLKLRLRINAGYCDIATTSANMSLTSTTMTSGNTCPVMVASAIGSNAMAGVLSASAGSLRIAFGPLQNNLTSLATAGAYFPFTTTRLMLPFYDITNPSSIVSNPIKKTTFTDVYAQYFKGRAGTGATTTQQNAPFNLQVSGSFKNIKYVIVTPYSETSAGHFVTAANAEQFQSPFDSAPWTCQPGSSIRNFQVQVGNDNVFAKTIDYDYEMFHDEIRKVSALNGGMTHEISNGLLDFQKFSTVQRFMVADCSRISNRDVPQSVIVSGVNGCCQGANLLVHIVYERDLSWDRLTGEVQLD